MGMEAARANHMTADVGSQAAAVARFSRMRRACSARRACAGARVLALVLAGCGGSTDSQQQPVAAEGTTAPPAPESTAGRGPSGAVAGNGAGGAGARAVGFTPGNGGAMAVTPVLGGTGGGGTLSQAGGAGTPPVAGAADGGAGANAADGGAGGATLPPITDPSMRGPFEFDFVDTADGLTSHSLFVPKQTGTQGKSPVVVWQCGNGASVSFYMSFLEHLASHGFFVVANKMSSSDHTAEAQSQSDAVDWVVAENDRSGSPYMGKLDVQHIGVLGHSLGALTSFETAASNPHVATSIHYSGGLTGNPVGFDMKWLASMTKPAAFLCGGDDTAAGPSCEQDFDQAPAMLPVFYGVLAGADHIGPFVGPPNGGDYGTAGVAWLRWQLAGDETFKAWFSGASCHLCSPPWTAKQRNVD